MHNKFAGRFKLNLSNNATVFTGTRILSHPTICAALKSGVDDVFSIAKVVIPILLPLSMAGTITVPPDTLSYATIALVISKMDVATLCVGYGKKEEKNK